MAKVLNFDKFMTEKNGETIDVTVFGKTYKVLSQIPAIVPVMMARAETETDGNAQIKMVMIAADAVFGSQAINEMCAKGMSVNELSDLVARTFAIINGTADADDDESEEISDEDSRTTAKGGRARKK